MKLADAVEYIGFNCHNVEMCAYFDDDDQLTWNICGDGLESSNRVLRLALIDYAKSHKELKIEEEAQAEQAERREYERLKAKYG